MRALWATVVVVAGCGRIGFAQLDGGAVGDAAVTGDGAAGLCPAFATFCDNFESGDVSKWTTTYVTNGATLVVDGAHAHSGSRALHGTVPPGTPGDAAAAVLDYSIRTTGVLAVREWVYQPVPLTNFDGVIILETQAGGPPTLLVGADDNQDWVASEGTTTSGTQDHSSTLLAVTSTWTCVELDYRFGVPSHIDVYVNDVSVLSVAAVQASAQFDELFVAVGRAQVNGSESIVDDVAVASQHIGCQ